MITEEIKTLLRALADGKQLQHRVSILDEEKFADCDAKMALAIITNKINSSSAFELRIKPESLECWVNFYEYGDEVGGAYKSKEDAQKHARAELGHRAVHMREVIE